MKEKHIKNETDTSRSQTATTSCIKSSLFLFLSLSFLLSFVREEKKLAERERKKERRKKGGGFMTRRENEGWKKNIK